MLTTTTSVLFRKPCVYVKVTHPSHVSKENHGSTCDMQLSNTQSLRACAHIMSDNDSKNISTKMSYCM